MLVSWAESHWRCYVARMQKNHLSLLWCWMWCRGQCERNRWGCVSSCKCGLTVRKGCRVGRELEYAFALAVSKACHQAATSRARSAMATSHGSDCRKDSSSESRVWTGFRRDVRVRPVVDGRLLRRQQTHERLCWQRKHRYELAFVYVFGGCGSCTSIW